MVKRLYTTADRERVVGIRAPSDAEEPYRTPWRRDYARLIHSAAFRRLQGKTQLFPGNHSDFFRNRLTHSLEVAQIAKSIATRLNHIVPFFKKRPIDTDLVETAALAHDLGHPPFGHNGEEALNECMANDGGFEGNAQTLRILAKLEKRQTKPQGNERDVQESVWQGADNRAGLDLTYRTLAAVLKYDKVIPGQPKGVEKGYYWTEAKLVEEIKRKVCGDPKKKGFKTIECTIMDLADDIAYSTYDLEDSFKAGFLTPLGMWTDSDALKASVAETVAKRLAEHYPKLRADEKKFAMQDVNAVLLEVFSDIFDAGPTYANELKVTAPQDVAAAMSYGVATTSENTAVVGFYRTRFTSDLVGNLIRGVNVEFDSANPVLSRAHLDVSLFKKMEVLKNFAFEALIKSPRLKVAEHRGKDIVRSIFKAIDLQGGQRLMPEDFQYLYDNLDNPSEKRRVVCDFIAGMTDRYAVQFYGRLFGTNPESIFAPV